MKTLRWHWSLAALLPVALAKNPVPYNPTRIFVSPNSTLAYVFRPAGDNGASLATVDLSQTLDASSISYTTVSDTLPFLQSSGGALPYTPTLDANGNISVVTGDCSKGAGGAQVWRFQPDVKSSSGQGTWSQYKTSAQEVGVAANEAGAQYLANSVSFSQTVSSEYASADVYVFGGMCPMADSTESTWTAAASYSNLMLTFTPSTSSASFNDFDIGVVPNGGPPIAQAGSCLTPLPPTYAMSSSGLPVAQQQDFVLIGGHTENAFINMSQIAVFSLPQQSWTFVSVQQSSGAKTDLARRQQSTQITPRSGHTAVMSEDGKTIVIYGGWVGDISTPADPQLAVLEVGAGFGGTGEWIWTIPQQSGSSMPGIAGLYGHGAALLPGGVMMVSGGYEIAGPSSRRMRRDASTASQKTYFYNVSGNTWIDTYEPSSSYLQSSHGHSSSSKNRSEQVGLGAGLGVGAALLLSVTGFYFWYRKRLTKTPADGERNHLTYSSDGSSLGQFDQPTAYANAGFDGRGGDKPPVGRQWVKETPSGGEFPRPPEMQHTTGMFVNVPSPTRGLRRGFGSKSYQYHQAPRFDENRLSGGHRNIHTITENVEEEEDSAVVDQSKNGSDELNEAQTKLREMQRVLNSDDPLDPFKDPEPAPLLVADPSNAVAARLSWMSGTTRKPVPRPGDGSASWMAYAGQAEQDGGRLSPTKTDRTSSSLSEWSVLSSNPVSRSVSTRTGAMMAAAAAADRFGIPRGGAISPYDDRSHTMSTTSTNGRTSPGPYTRNSMNGSPPQPPHKGTSTESFATARSGFPHLQNEGEALLGGAPGIDRDDPYQRALAANTPNTSPLQNRHPRVIISPPSVAFPVPRQKGWVGSLRRVLAGVTEARSFSLTGVRERYTDEPITASPSHTAQSSPTKSTRPEKPRRSASDGGSLLQQKRGRTDWEKQDYPPYHDEFTHPHPSTSSKSDANADEWGAPRRSSLDRRREAEEDWDVEGAAVNRDVQVLFTIPKARLRVVNDDMDRASLRSASEGAVSRSESLKRVATLEDAVRELRVRSDGERSATGNA